MRLTPISTAPRRVSRRSCPPTARSFCARLARALAFRGSASGSQSLLREEAERLRAALGPWPVSGPAVAIGTKALNDLDWTDAMGGRLGEDAERLDALLVDAGWRVLGGTRLFRLAARDDAGERF